MSVRKSENSESEAKKHSIGKTSDKVGSAKTAGAKSSSVKNNSLASETDIKVAQPERSKKRPTVTGDEKPGAEKKKTSAPTKKASENKTQPKKTTSRKSRAKSDPDVRGGEQSSKTPQVMKLVEQKADMVNPTILAGKSSIPRRLRGLEPLTRIMKRDAAEIFGADGETETYNLTALVIEDNAREILRRFNACDCNICVEKLSQLTAEEVPARFAKLSKKAVEYNVSEVQELKAPLKKAVTSRMIRLVMQNKKRSYHDI